MLLFTIWQKYCPEESAAKREALLNLFAKSDLKNVEGSDDIIKSMFNVSKFLLFFFLISFDEI